MTNRAVILTTHSMEECEALCSRIGILVNGALKCVGPSQHLKTRFGRGFQVDISTGSNDSADARNFLLEHFPDAEKLEDYAGKMKYKILHRRHAASPDARQWKLKDIFALVEESKERLGISEYSVGQTTLEQVFIAFAKKGDHEEFGGRLSADEEEEEAAEQQLAEWGAAPSAHRPISRVPSFDAEDSQNRIVTPSSYGYVPAEAQGGINF